MILNIITVVVIPFIVQLLKKVKMPTKFAPYAAIVVAVIIVGVAKIFAGAELDFQVILNTVAQAIGLAGVSVLGYDLVKKTTEK